METIYLTPKCEYESFILENIMCKPLFEDWIFRGLLFFVFGLTLILLFKLAKKDEIKN